MSSDWIAPVAGIAGTLLGGTLAAIFSRLSEKARWDREDRNRFIQDRKEGYVSLLTAVQELVIVGLAQPKPDRETLSYIQSHRRNVLSAIYEIQLVGAEEVQRAARGVLQAVMSLEWSYQISVENEGTPAEEDKQEHERFVQQLIQARNAFLVAARTELRMPPIEP